MENSVTDGRDEKIFDALFYAAADETLKEEMDALPSREELDKLYPPDKDFEKRVYAAIKREGRADKRKKAGRTFLKIAAGFLIVTVISVGALMSVTASRNFILNFFMDIRDDHVAFDFGAGNEPAASGDGIVLGYMPEGFELISTYKQDAFCLYVYMDGHNNRIIVQRFLGSYSVMGVDYEYLDSAEILINGEPAFLFMPIDDYRDRKILWGIGEDVITITTSLDSETLVRIAEGLTIR